MHPRVITENEAQAALQSASERLSTALEKAKSWNPPAEASEAHAYLAKRIDNLRLLANSYAECYRTCLQIASMDPQALGGTVTNEIKAWITELNTHTERYDTASSTFDTSFFGHSAPTLPPGPHDTPVDSEGDESWRMQQKRKHRDVSLGNSSSGHSRSPLRSGKRLRGANKEGGASGDLHVGAPLIVPTAGSANLRGRSEMLQPPAGKKDGEGGPIRGGQAGSIDETTDTEMENSLPNLYKSRRTGSGRAFIEPCSRCETKNLLCLVSTTGKTRMVACVPCSLSKCGGCTKSGKAKGTCANKGDGKEPGKKGRLSGPQRRDSVHVTGMVLSTVGGTTSHSRFQVPPNEEADACEDTRTRQSTRVMHARFFEVQPQGEETSTSTSSSSQFGPLEVSNTNLSPFGGRECDASIRGRSTSEELRSDPQSEAGKFGPKTIADEVHRLSNQGLAERLANLEAQLERQFIALKDIMKTFDGHAHEVESRMTAKIEDVERTVKSQAAEFVHLKEGIAAIWNSLSTSVGPLGSLKGSK
ncbi:hypothetical protein D9611_008856 [Ephemerocybe angulata]|uniref:Uncharacterized protein n=1 Tax=Ephemerocybe angulata TaxID=980116 RepID=A0A8H5BYG9_9AGAR|nr:hypothetical protein D9611_008856 [Tulosesus angulatus]